MNAQTQARRPFDRSGASSGAPRFASSAGFDIDEIFDLLGRGSPFGGMPTGEPIAKGLDEVIAKIQSMSRDRGMELPPGLLDTIRATAKKIGNDESIVLHEMDDGIVISGKAPGFDAFGGPRRGHHRDAEPMDNFMSATLPHLVASHREKDLGKKVSSPAIDIMFASMLAATELLRWGRHQGKPPVEVMSAMAKLIDDLAKEERGKFRNLQNHLTGYAVSLPSISVQLKTFVDNPRADLVDPLGTELSKLPAVITSVLRDAKDDAKRAAEEAMAV